MAQALAALGTNQTFARGGDRRGPARRAGADPRDVMARARAQDRDQRLGFLDF